MRGDVSKNVSACKKFLIIELHARLVGATMIELGIDEINGCPSTDSMYENMESLSKQAKRECLKSLTEKVVDKYILCKDRVQSILEKTRKAQDEEDNARAPSDRFPCRFPGCEKSFKHDGKRRRDHENSHDGFVIKDSTKSRAVKAPKSSLDDMYNYQCSFMEVSMLLTNFYDAVSEGDGLRLVRCWKFILLHLIEDGASSRKYALEAFYLLCQINSILTPRAAHRIIWNRFYKSKPGPAGNIPLDLALEHFNRLIKILMRNLGPNALNKRAIDRYCKALATNKNIMDNFDTICSINRRSGLHTCHSITGDLEKIVKELLEHRALVCQENRSLKHFSGFKDSLLADSDIRSLFKWINTHKKNVNLNKCAR